MPPRGGCTLSWRGAIVRVNGAVMQKRAIVGVGVALLVAMVGLAAALRDGAQSVPVRSEAPPLDAARRHGTSTAAPAAAAPIVRERAPWLPDGRIWIRATRADGGACRAMSITTVADERRWFEPAPDIEPADGGWFVVPPPPAAHGLALVAQGHGVAWLREPSPAMRHEIVLPPLPVASVRLVDERSGVPLPGIGCMVSAAPLPDDLPPSGALPGADPRTALHGATSDGRGLLCLPPLESPLHYRVVHPHYLPGTTAPDRLIVASWVTELPLIEPFVGAVRIVGDEMLHGSISVRSSPIPGDAHRLDLQRIATGLRSRWPEALAVAVLPRDGAQPQACATVELARSGARDVPVDLVPASRFVEPQRVDVTFDPEGAPAVVEVTFRAPPLPDGWPLHDVPILVTGPAVRELAQFGAPLRLRPGRYRISGVGFAAVGALARDHFDVQPGPAQEFTARWRAGVTCCRFDVTSASGAPIDRVVVLRQSADGREHGIEVQLDADGRGLAWLSGDVDSVRIAAEGHATATTAAIAHPAQDCQHFRVCLAVR